MSVLLSNESSSFSVSSPVAGSTFSLKRLKGREAISELFSFDVLVASENANVDLSQCMGKDMSITFSASGSESNADERYFHGTVARVSQVEIEEKDKGNVSYYRMILRPKAWLLTQSKSYRIFQNQTAAQIIKDVLNEGGVTDIQDDLRSAGQTTREYCVQYGESNFDFISRLMEEKGIAYTFSHESSLHKMILMEAVGSYQFSTRSQTISISKAQSGALIFNEIIECEVHHGITLGSVQGVDYNFENPNTALKSTSQGESQIGGEWMEYPAGVDHEQKAAQSIVDSTSDSIINAAESTVDTLTGNSTCPFFTAGKNNSCNSIYTAAKSTSRPRIFGSQTAKVVGPEGEEIWTDKYGRIK
ncbi:uncharacterized protein LOC111320250, partial [Stylophora pistillata]|uniref:uncharacterized protein LOC111320250 n=1 Tax=Stylophora pistillata TaxID=50429 RepID=UPI000C03BA09